MAYLNSVEGCCGLRELDNLSDHTDPVEAMKQIAAQVFGELDTLGPVNPFTKPADIPWQRNTWGERYFTNANGRITYAYEAEDWVADRGYDEGRIDNKWRYAVFTQAGSRKSYGRNFAALIKKENLGEVVQATTKTVKNPNSGNILKAWLWTVNYPNLKKWAIKQVTAQAKAKGAK